jgi:hypothetical protein
VSKKNQHIKKLSRLYQVVLGSHIIGEHEGGSSPNGANCWPGAGAVDVNHKALTRGKKTEEMGEEDWWGSIELGLDELSSRGGVVFVLMGQGVDDEGWNWQDVDVPLLLQGDGLGFVLGCWAGVVPGKWKPLGALDAALLGSFAEDEGVEGGGCGVGHLTIRVGVHVNVAVIVEEEGELG